MCTVLLSTKTRTTLSLYYLMPVNTSHTLTCEHNLFLMLCMLLPCNLMDSVSLTGSLIQVPLSEKGKITRGRLGSLSLKKEGERQCFLFSKHLIICTRGSGGKLYITKVQQGKAQLKF